MAPISPMAALSHQCPLHLLLPLPPSCSCSSSADLCIVRICPNSTTARSCSSVASSSSAFSSSLLFGRRRKIAGAANASICFPEESAPYPSLHVRLSLASPRDPACLLLCRQERNGSLGWGRKRTASSVWCQGRGGGGEVGVKEVEQEVANKGDESVVELEAEVYDFMQQSVKPNDFPTKEELIAARRMDLVEAIVAHGGWLAYGWDLNDAGASSAAAAVEEKREQVYGGEQRADAVNSSMPETNSVIMKHNESSAGWLDKEILQQQSFSCTMGSSAASSPVSSSGRPIETKGGDKNGIEGILSRLEKERSFIYTADSKDKKIDNKFSSKNKDYDLRTAGEMFSWGNVNNVENLNDIPMDDYAHPMDQSASGLRNGGEEPSSLADQDQLHSRLQYLESELASVLTSLRSRADAIVSHKSEENSLKELQRLSDAWEFQETEIMNARDKLRSTKAKLTVLQGKMALEIIEAQKIVEAKQKRFDAAQRALRLLRTTYVVWPNSASEVLLAGSFDGWNSKRRMERSSTGIFSLYLKLYPGQYEIKFIVDGVWKVDPLRPIVYNNGFENNVLIIS